MAGEGAQGRKLTVREIAKQCGISKSRVSEYMQMAGGKQTVEADRESKRERKRRSRSSVTRKGHGQRRRKGKQDKQAEFEPPEPKPLPPEEYRPFLIGALARAFEGLLSRNDLTRFGLNPQLADRGLREAPALR